MVRTLFSVFAATLGLSATAQEICYVDDDAVPGGDGRSWATAYQFLQDPLL